MYEQAEFYPRDRDWHPPARTPQYKSSILRAPGLPPFKPAASPGDLTGPVFGHSDIAESDNDLIRNFAQPGEFAIGPRIFLYGRVLDENGQPQPNTLVEIWQANAGGRYRHSVDTYLAPLDPNFAGCGRTITDADGGYRFHTIQPGPYPWPNSENSWRPAHVHFSLFGTAFAQRLITQCYFEGDPLIPLCPIVGTIPSPRAIDQLVAKLDMETTVPFDTLAYRFDIILRGRNASRFEDHGA